MPSRVGVTRSVVVIPGTASIFSEKSGTKKLWITSSERILKTTGWPFGQVQVGETICLPLALRVGELERELPLGHVDRHLVRLGASSLARSTV